MQRFRFLLVNIVDVDAGTVEGPASDSDPLPSTCSCSGFLFFPFVLEGLGLIDFLFCDIGITSVSESKGLGNLKTKQNYNIL